MKKAPPVAKKAVPATLTRTAEQKLTRWVILLALAVPIIDTLVLFPLSQLILANSSGTGAFYQIFSQLTEICNLAAFFLLIALAVYCAIADSTRTLGRILALHGISSVFAVVLLRLGVVCLLAYLDNSLFLPFELCNYTLSWLTDHNGAELMGLALSLFLSQVILFAILAIAAIVALRGRQKALAGKADLSPVSLYNSFDATPLPKLLNLSLIFYAVLALLNQIVDTYATLTKAGTPTNFSDLLSLIVPYFLLAIYCLLCYLVLQYGARFFARLGAEG